jgi:hypothetical protein
MIRKKVADEVVVLNALNRFDEVEEGTEVTIE